MTTLEHFNHHHHDPIAEPPRVARVTESDGSDLPFVEQAFWLVLIVVVLSTIFWRVLVQGG
jgi:hypothetical protein